jgi:hypothetical protein
MSQSARAAWGTELRNYRLYGTSACHLCELAQGMIMTEKPLRGGLVVEDVDISESDTLFERYGVRIPVLQHPDGRELDWPFSPAQLRQFLAS